MTSRPPHGPPYWQPGPDPVSLAAALAHLCKQPTPCPDGWMVCCPSHDDQTPSLHITPTADKVLLKCFAGCPTPGILATLGLSERDLSVDQDAGPAQRRERIVAVYDYTDAQGNLLHQTVRFVPKKFRQRRPDPNQPGAFVWNLRGIEPVLYRLPAVLQAIAQGQPIYFVEGEKDADALTAKGLTATCNAMGAGKWRPSYTETLRGAQVVILADYDVPGKRHAESIAYALHDVVKLVKIVDAFHTATDGSDISDWLEAGGTRAEFEAMVDAAPRYMATPNQAPPGFAHYSTSNHGPPLPALASFPSLGTQSTQGPVSGDGMRQQRWYQEQVLPYVSKRDLVDANDTTICAFLRHHSYWQGKLWWNDMANKPMVGHDELSDYLITKIGAIFGELHRVPIRTDRVLARCLAACCFEHKHDPLQQYLEALTGWDGTPRLESWLGECAGVVNTAYNRFISRILLVSMIARAYEPGCLYRNVVVFEGPEEFRKSSFVAGLVPDKRWHISLTSSFENKDVPMLIQGIWVAELSELDSLSRTEETRLKSFISETEDAYVPKWQLFRIAPKRRTIFVGTTNESNWLKSVGNTRFWPVRIVHPMDVEQFSADREQLYAEAKLWYHDHLHDWWDIPPEVRTQAVDEREDRRQASVYESDLADWLEKGRFDLKNMSPEIHPVPHETTWAEIATGFLRHDTPDKWKDMGVQKQIAQALKSLGWRQKVVKRDGKSWRIWSEEPTTPF